MAAEVSSLLQVIGRGYKEEKKTGLEFGVEKSTLVTKDLLGGSSILADSRELDLDLQVPDGWEKMLDLKSGKVYVQKCQDQKHQTNQTVLKHENLNIPSSSSPSKITLNLFEENCLDLKLVSTSPSSSNYTSVCTLDKVKSALERAEKEPIKKRWKVSSSPSYSSSSSSVKELPEEENEERVLWSPVAAACSSCLSYVMIMKSNPKCPRCNSLIRLPPSKKPRIDLNM